MEILYIKDFPSLKIGSRVDKTERDYRLILAPEIGNTENQTIIYSSMPPGMKSDYHLHESNDELMYFLGNSESIIEGVRYRIKKNSLVLIHKGEKHQNINKDKKKTLDILCIFLPAIMPYGRLKKLIKITKDYLHGS